MTLVYERVLPEGMAVTHAFVIGCGRFAAPPSANLENRPSTVAGARKMVEFLVSHADGLIAPLATIDCLLSDPAVARGEDRLAGGHPHDSRGDDRVDAALGPTVEAQGELWLQRCRPGDHLFFYVASHGAAEADRSALAFFEDTATNRHNPFNHVLNFSLMVEAIGASTGAGACWAFFDACREVRPDILQRLRPTIGFYLANPDFVAVRAGRDETFALAGSRFGEPAWAPTGNEPPYFTQTLLLALSGASVEAIEGHGWLVTAQALGQSLDDLANVALDYRHLQVQRIGSTSGRAYLLRPQQARVPVAVRTEFEADLTFALEVVADGGAGHVHRRSSSDREAIWRFSVDPGHRTYVTRATFPPERHPYQETTFVGLPPAQIVELKR